MKLNNVTTQQLKNKQSGSLARYLFVLAAVSSMTTEAVTNTATVDANVVSTISLTTSNGLAFGDISAGAVAGSVILTPGSSRTSTGGTSINTAVAGSAASFDVQGDANASYSISLPVSVVLSDVSSHTMVVDNFTSSPSPSGVLDSSGLQTLFVGATLNVGSNQAFGTYTGQMSVTVDYN